MSPTPDATLEELSSAADRLGYPLGPEQLTAVVAAVVAAAPPIARLRA